MPVRHPRPETRDQRRAAARPSADVVELEGTVRHDPTTDLKGASGHTRSRYVANEGSHFGGFVTRCKDDRLTTND